MSSSSSPFMNLTAIKGEEDTARLHFLDCAGLLTAYDFSGRSVVDVGTGAGFPGIPLKILQPDINLTLLDSHGKRMSVFGTRPEAIKMAPLVLELDSRPEFESIVCVTAQHRQMLDGVLDCFSISPDYDLDIMQSGQTLSDITSRVLNGLGGVLREAKPDLVLVHGDTTTTFASALGAFYEKIPVGHVEAGLRTFDRYSPFPEEMNRCMVARLATYHFAPTAQNAKNLKNENVRENIFVTGNTVIDAMKYTIGDGTFTTPALQSLDFANRRVIAMTCHRRENYGEPMENIFRAVRRMSMPFLRRVEFVTKRSSPTSWMR